MEQLFAFLLRASAGIMLFYMVYWLFLRNETFYRGNRWFLLLALISAVIIPIFPLQYEVLVEPENKTTIFQAINDTFKNIKPVQPEVTEKTVNFGLENIILTIYITGTVIFLIRLLTQTIVLIHLMFKYRIKSLNGIRIVENEKYGLPFSFFNVVFINPKFHTPANLPEILAHEKVHIREFHWFDLLFTELLTVIFWFNPFIWMFEHAIKQNHEYLADQGVLAQGHNLARYQALLINQLMGMQIIGITNNLNFALNTNRFKMMTKMKTSRLLGVKFMWALPAVALLLFAFAEPEYQRKEAKVENQQSNVQKSLKEQVIHGKVVKEENKKPLAGASIIIKGTSIGTVSDFEGNFTLTNPNPEIDEKTGGLITEFVISYVGYQTVSERFGPILGQPDIEGVTTSYDFPLKEGVIQLDLKEMLKEIPPPPAPPAPAGEKTMAPPPPPPPVPDNADETDELYNIVESLPEYPDGMGFLANDVWQTAKIMAREKGVKGNATVGFTIDETGKPVNIKILESDNELAGKSAASIVMNMKNWKPGSQHGKPVPVNYILPMEF
jgi:hypothetical protein